MSEQDLEARIRQLELVQEQNTKVILEQIAVVRRLLKQIEKELKFGNRK